MSPSSSHFPSRNKPWDATGVNVIWAIPYLFRARSLDLRFASDGSILDWRLTLSLLPGGRRAGDQTYSRTPQNHYGAWRERLSNGGGSRRFNGNWRGAG